MLNEEQAASTSVEAAAAVTVIALRPKNTHRLQRIFRKPKSTVAPRRWRSEEDAATRRIGISATAVRSLIETLTDSEKSRAAANLDPLTATQEALALRAARFGVQLTTAAAPVMVVDEETLKRREARFMSTESVALEAAMAKREARFGPMVELKLSEVDRTAMEARARRFAA